MLLAFLNWQHPTRGKANQSLADKIAESVDFENEDLLTLGRVLGAHEKVVVRRDGRRYEVKVVNDSPAGLTATIAIGIMYQEHIAIPKGMEVVTGAGELLPNMAREQRPFYKKGAPKRVLITQESTPPAMKNNEPFEVKEERKEFDPNVVEIEPLGS